MYLYCRKFQGEICDKQDSQDPASHKRGSSHVLSQISRGNLRQKTGLTGSQDSPSQSQTGLTVAKITVFCDKKDPGPTLAPVMYCRKYQGEICDKKQDSQSHRTQPVTNGTHCRKNHGFLRQKRPSRPTLAPVMYCRKYQGEICDKKQDSQAHRTQPVTNGTHCRKNHGFLRQKRPSRPTLAPVMYCRKYQGEICDKKQDSRLTGPSQSQTGLTVAKITVFCDKKDPPDPHWLQSCTVANIKGKFATKNRTHRLTGPSQSQTGLTVAKITVFCDKKDPPDPHWLQSCTVANIKGKFATKNRTHRLTGPSQSQTGLTVAKITVFCDKKDPPDPHWLQSCTVANIKGKFATKNRTHRLTGPSQSQTGLTVAKITVFCDKKDPPDPHWLQSCTVANIKGKFATNRTHRTQPVTNGTHPVTNGTIQS